MSAKVAVFVVFAQALLIQSALSQVCGRSAFAASPSLGSYGLAGSTLSFPSGYNGLPSALSGNGLTCNGLAGNSLTYDNIYTPAIGITPTTGGGLPISSASAIPPNNLLVASENVYTGTLAVGGELPFLGTVGLEGVLPTVGSGAVNHACGNGATRMVSQDGAAVTSGFGTGFAPAATIAPGNMCGTSFGAYGNAAATAPFGCGANQAGLAYPAAGLAGAYPGAGFTEIYPTASYGAGFAPYGGTGEGNVVVAGELPVTGSSVITGLVPIMGAVRFSGNVPAAGAVTIFGKCACSCGSPYMY